MNSTAKSPHTTSDLGQLVRLCHVVRWLLIIFLFIQIGLFIMSWIMPAPMQFGLVKVDLDATAQSPGTIHTLDVGQRVVGFLVGLPGLILLTFGARRLGKALKEFQNRNFFSSQAIGHLRAFAGSALVSAVLFNLEEPLRAIAIRLFASRGEKVQITFEVTGNELLLLLVCGLFYLIVGLMQEGRRLSEENEGFV